MGPVCNHDLGVLLRLVDDIDRKMAQRGIDRIDATREAVSEMLVDMGDHEYYCAAYSSNR